MKDFCDLPPWKAVTGANGEADIDVSAADYTAFILLLTIANGAAKQFIDDCWVFFDLAKATTGFLAVHSTNETITFAVARKIDGTNYRIDHNTNGPGISSAIAENAAGTIAACGLHVGPIGPDEDVQIFVKLSAEEAADVEIPYNIYYRGPAPTITEVAAA